MGVLPSGLFGPRTGRHGSLLPSPRPVSPRKQDQQQFSNNIGVGHVEVMFQG